MSERWIRASDISEYVYCRRAWWLRQVAGAPSRHRRLQEAGSAYHGRHATQVARAERSRRLAYGLVFLAVFFFVYYLWQVL